MNEELIKKLKELSPEERMLALMMALAKGGDSE